MGGRDFAGREKKKPKKDAKQKSSLSSGIQEVRPEVEVIKKGKKNKDFEDED
jgi:hypothetical protein